MCAYKLRSPLPVEEGGVEKETFTPSTVVCGGTISTGPLQNVASTGEYFQVLTSQGAGSLPTWAEIDQATYFETLSADPSAPELGQVWYRTDTNVFRGAVADGGGASTWVARSDMNSVRKELAAAGTGSDTTSFGGNTGGGDTYSARTERFDNGTNIWTNRTDMNTGRRDLGGIGTAALSLAFGGVRAIGVSNLTELFDGGLNTWTNKANLNVSRFRLAGAGNSTNGLSFGGDTGGSKYSAVTEIYDGGANSWSTSTNLNMRRSNLAGAGTSSSALSFGGFNAIRLGNTEAWDGTATTWTSKADMNVNANQMGGAGSDANDAMWFGGSIIIATTEIFNGISNIWVAADDMNTARNLLGGCGTTSNALACGGNDGATLATTERFSGGGGLSIVTFTVS